jgi:hypothetical protein
MNYINMQTRKAGHRDAGHKNAGHKNAGHKNAGHKNAGHRNALTTGAGGGRAWGCPRYRERGNRVRGWPDRKGICRSHIPMRRIRPRRPGMGMPGIGMPGIRMPGIRMPGLQSVWHEVVVMERIARLLSAGLCMSASQSSSGQIRTLRGLH